MIGLVLIRKFKSRLKTLCTIKECVVDLTDSRFKGVMI